MKKHLTGVLVVLFVLFLPVLAGCSEVESELSGIRVSCINVGKGDCILVQADKSSALIDTGYENTADEVVSYLREQGVDQLECVVITHYDRDHVGGLQAIGKAYDIGTVWLPNYEGADKQYRTVTTAVKKLSLPARSVTEVQVLDLGGASLTIFPTSLTYVPDANGDEGNDNDLSLVVTLTSGSDSYLFAGDLEEEGIDAFLKAGYGSFDVLKMPHHGQCHSNVDDMLDSVKPQIALITDAPKDAADKKTLKLLKVRGVDTYSTSVDGTIVVTSDGTGSYTVSTGN